MQRGSATRLCLLVSTCVATSLASAPTSSAQQSMNLDRVATGLTQPVFATHAPGDPNRLYICEQAGRIRILDLVNLSISATFLNITNEVQTGGERGLLGLAFHPDYEVNGLFYVNFTGTQGGGDTRVREYARLNADTADPSSARAILSFDQPFFNHNGGWMDFGPDGFLYISTGDGGSANDPLNNALDLTNNRLGKLLRIDVNTDDFPTDASRNYGIPVSNPFVGVTGDDETWAYGLRNPWRCSFDRETGDLYIGDVGQGQREEINVQPANSTGGENYGWRLREGTLGGFFPGAIDPIYEYNHNGSAFGGFSVTGGYVYRGPVGVLDGIYFFGDFVTDRIWSLEWDGSSPQTHDGTNFTELTDWENTAFTTVGSIENISSFAEDAVGNLYVLDYGGEIFRIASATRTFGPKRFKTRAGTVLNGRLADLQQSDESRLTLRPAVGKDLTTQRLELGVQIMTAEDAPSSVTFRFESAMAGGASGDVIQTIEMLDYDTGQQVTIDTRAVMTVDAFVTIALPGDPSRFVHPEVGSITARITWTSESFSSTPFAWTIDVDAATWTITG